VPVSATWIPAVPGDETVDGRRILGHCHCLCERCCDLFESHRGRDLLVEGSAVLDREDLAGLERRCDDGIVPVGLLAGRRRESQVCTVSSER
jgi:hypothetical protein